jgi:hypothetical protein
MMTKVFLVAGWCCFAVTAMAQKKDAVVTVPLRAENWTFRPGTVEFVGGASPAMKIGSSSGTVVLKDFDFTDGTIEFDDQPVEARFASFYFRWQDSLEGECFYFRVPHSGDVDAIQYTPIIKGINFWNMLEYYQGNVVIQQQAANHVKLVISGRQMRVYVNDQVRPALEVPYLEGNTAHGTLAFDGQVIISNLVVRRGQVEGLAAAEGLDPTYNDSRYIRHWQVTEPDSIPRGIEFSYNLLPGKLTSWKPITAERRGLIDLSRLYGGSASRRIAWLKTTVHAGEARTCQLRLGFLNDTWVMVNGRFVYIDKNIYGHPMAKVPDGRLSIDNANVTLPLQKGDNELIVGVANDFYGWGIMARLDDLRGITLEK